MAITGKVGAVYRGVSSASFTDKPTTKDVENKRYQITDATLRYWTMDEVTVKKNGTAITSGFMLERVGGTVVFFDALKSTDTVTVSGKNYTLAPCGGFFNWSVDGESDHQDVSTFGSDGWKDFAHILNSWSGSADAYWGDDNFAESVGELVVLALYIDSGPAKSRLEGYAVVSGDSIDTPVDGIVEEGISFQGTGPLQVVL